MCRHEDKYCPRCQAVFECKVGSIELCQCQAVRLSEEETAFIGELYTDCLCASCLLQLKGAYHNRKLTDKIKHLLRIGPI